MALFICCCSTKFNMRKSANDKAHHIRNLKHPPPSGTNQKRSKVLYNIRPIRLATVPSIDWKCKFLGGVGDGRRKDPYWPGRLGRHARPSDARKSRCIYIHLVGQERALFFSFSWLLSGPANGGHWVIGLAKRQETLWQPSSSGWGLVPLCWWQMDGPATQDSLAHRPASDWWSSCSI